MNISYNWLKKYIAADLSAEAMATILTDIGLEVESFEKIETVRGGLQGVVVGEVLTCEKHPDSDHLHVTTVDVGAPEPLRIVCGAPNCRKGLKVLCATVGAVLYPEGGDEAFKIKRSKIRGVESLGMLCAEDELGIGASHDGIMELPADAPVGMPAKEYLHIEDDYLIGVGLTPNRVDAASHIGVARDLAAYLRAKGDAEARVLWPDVSAFAVDDHALEIGVTVENAEAAPRYTGVTITGCKIGPSPDWMQNALRAAGIHPKNNLVDITNYVMLATGQPTHAFDSDHIAGHVIVRRAGEGEKLLLLNGKELALSSDDLVIADDAGVVGLAGVMGGAKDSILPDTSKVILEVANFDAKGIRRTALRYDNRTEASARYEKAIDPERCDQAFDLSMQLFSQLYPEIKVTGLVDQYPEHLKQAEIDVPLSWLERRLGKRLSPDEIKHKMELLGYGISFDGDNMHVVVPTWRSTGDVSIQADIMEEVARMYGYENFEAEPITTTFDGAINQLDKDLERRIKEYLAIRCGMQEIFTYPWMEESYVNAVLQSTEGILSLSTPPSPAERFVRSSLLPNLCKAVVKNERYFDEFSIFETAQVFRDENYTSPYDPREKLPSQRKNVAGAFATTDKDITALFRKAKGVVEMMARYVHMEALTFKQAEKPVWADNVVWLNIYRGDEKVGDLALLAKKVSMACGIKNLAVMLFELDVDALRPFRSRTNTFTHLAEYPMTDYDISLLVDGSVQWKDVAQTVRGIKSELLHGAAFVDEYRGKQVPAGKKSLTLRLAIGSKDKTLTSAEIEEVASGVLNKIAKRFGAELRR